MMSTVPVAIIGAGPYGLSLAAQLAERKIRHRIFGQPMSFWSDIAAAGSRRYLKSYCFGTNLSTPRPGFTFADYNFPRGLETFEPCSIGNFADYGRWFQQNNVPWVEPAEVTHVRRQPEGFVLRLATGEPVRAANVVLATGLSGFAHVPPMLASLPPQLCTHTSRVTSFEAFGGRSVAVIGAGQSALEAAALLQEARARPLLLARDRQILWQTRVMRDRSLWRRIRSPITGLGTGPKAWLLTKFPDGMHRLPAAWRTRFVRSHLPAEGAWWLKERVEGLVPVRCNTTVIGARENAGRLELQLHEAARGSAETLVVDHLIAGTGYSIDVERMAVLDPELRAAVGRLDGAPLLSRTFESSVPGLHMIGPVSAISFGPLFRFVVGAEFAAQTIATHLATKAMLAA
jgi:cation diffusion facilitator CzcD-associated flavoprotein CzcO